MNTFRVGQRVRKVAHINFMHLNVAPENRRSGVTVPIGELGTICAEDGTIPGTWIVRFDHTRTDARFSGFTVYPYMIEPIDDDSRELTTWSQCIWKPQGVRAS